MVSIGPSKQYLHETYSLYEMIHVFVVEGMPNILSMLLLSIFQLLYFNNP